MAKTASLVLPADVASRARTNYARNWREWQRQRACGLLGGEAPAVPELSVGLHPPRESDLLTAQSRAQARDWVSAWRECDLPGALEWQERRWARVGNQVLPMRICIHGAADIARWAGQAREWERACARVDDMAALLAQAGVLEGEPGRARCACPGTGADSASPSHAVSEPVPAASVAAAVRTSVGDWCALDAPDWERALAAFAWLQAHPDERRYARQLPIHGIDTKWMERHGGALRPLYRAVTGRDFAFAQPRRQFRCKACSPSAALAGCRDFALDAPSLASLADPGNATPVKALKAVVICENLVNTLCLDGLADVLAIHGGGFAVTELQEVGWLRDIPLWYWGDLDSNGFAILNAVRSFAPHARSLMMDAPTLQRHRDLCVEEPKPATGAFERLNPGEREALSLLRAGNLRLEQERIEWRWVERELNRAGLLGGPFSGVDAQ